MIQFRYALTTLISVVLVALIFLGGCSEDGAGTVASTDTAMKAEEAAVLSKYPPSGIELTLKQVSEHVYYAEGAAGIATDNEGFISNAGVVITGDGVVVFDSLGSPSLAAKLVQRIRELTSEPIRKVIVSHYHADHIYGLQVFEELGAEIIGPLGAELYLNSEGAIARLEERRFSLDPWVNENTRLVGPDRYLGESETFKLGAVTFTLNPLGAAHSDGDLALYLEPDRVLLSGDLIFEGRVPFLGDANTGAWLDILRRMETQGLVALIPGHGPAASNPNEAIELTRRYLEYLRKTMGAAAADFIQFSEAYAATDWSEFEHLPAFEAAHRRNAYQVYLSMEEEGL